MQAVATPLGAVSSLSRRRRSSGEYHPLPEGSRLQCMKPFRTLINSASTVYVIDAGTRASRWLSNLRHATLRHSFSGHYLRHGEGYMFLSSSYTVAHRILPPVLRLSS